MKIGFVPKKTKSNLLFQLYTAQIAEGGGSCYPIVPQKEQPKPHTCVCTVIGTQKPTYEPYGNGPQTVQNRAKNSSNVHRSSHSYAHTIIIYLVLWRILLFLQRAPSNREGGWFNWLFQAKKHKQFLIKKMAIFRRFC